VDPHESLLSQIHGAVVIIGHPVDVARNLVSITTHQLSKGVLVTGPRGFQQSMVGSRVLQHVLLQGRGEAQLIDGSQRIHQGRWLSQQRSTRSEIAQVPGVYYLFHAKAQRSQRRKEEFGSLCVFATFAPLRE